MQVSEIHSNVFPNLVYIFHGVYDYNVMCGGLLEYVQKFVRCENCKSLDTYFVRSILLFASFFRA